MAKTLYLIDGHAQMFRAYHAIRTSLSSPVTGEPTQAIYGFAVMLLKVLNQYKPDYLAIAIDTPGPTFRDVLYPLYKATRDKAPEDFASQVHRILEMVALFGIPVLGVAGAEADDVIATIAQQVEHEQRWTNTRLRIVSRDKDLQQLLSDCVAMFDVHTDELLDVAACRRSTG
jgi:DNA polymerase-1